MRLSYQVSTPEVKKAAGVTAYQADLETSFKMLADNGYDGAELMICEPAKIDADKIIRLSQQYSLPICMVCSGEVFGQDGLCFTDPDPARRAEAIKRVKDAVDLSVKVGANIVNVGRVRGGFSLGGNHEDERRLSVQGIRQVAEYAGEKGALIALEPVNSIAATFINTTQQGIAVIDEIGLPSLKLMLDSNHMFIDDPDPMQSIEDAKGYFVFVHLVDSNRLYPGNCKLDFKQFLRKVKEVGYDGWVSVEVFQRPNQDVALKKSIAHIRPILDNL